MLLLHSTSSLQIASAKKELANKADHILVFPMQLPPVGLHTYTAKAAPLIAPARYRRHVIGVYSS